MTNTEALAVLAKDVEEDKNWRSARSKLTEVLTAAIAADATCHTLTRQHTSLESDIAALRAVFSKLDADYQALQKQYGQLDQEHRAKKQQLDATLRPLLAEVVAAQTLKQDTEEQLAKISAKLSA